MKNFQDVFLLLYGFLVVYKNQYIRTGAGLDEFPVATSSLACRSGLFDFHHADADSVLIGLDNRVWHLSRAPGDPQEGVVERLLESHFCADMASNQPALGRPSTSSGGPRRVARRRPGFRTLVDDDFGNNGDVCIAGGTSAEGFLTTA